MSEGKISKISLLLLINEIIKTQIVLLRNEQIELSSYDSSSDEYNEETEEIEENKDNIEKEKENKENIKQLRFLKNEEKKINRDIDNDGSKEKEKVKVKVKKGTNKINGMQYNMDNSVDQTEQNIISFKMKEMGISVGEKLVERMLITKNEFNDIRDILKFVGKDVWNVLFNKNADKLQIYKKGTYIVVDNNLEFWLKHLFLDINTNKKNSFMHYFLILITGVLTGVLNRLNVKNSITYDLNYPQCSFQINISESEQVETYQ